MAHVTKFIFALFSIVLISSVVLKPEVSNKAWHLVYQKIRSLKNSYYSEIDLVKAENVIRSIPNKKFETVFIGDSMVSYLERVVDCENTLFIGFSGFTTEKIANVILDKFSLSDATVILWMGSNDVGSGINLTSSIKTIESLISFFEAKRNTVAVIEVPFSDGWKRDNETIAYFNYLLNEITYKRGIELVSVNEVISHERMLKEQYTNDGLHLTTIGSIHVLRMLLKTLESSNLNCEL